MIKVLWLCNASFSEVKLKSTASWLQPLAEGLACHEKIQIVNVTQGQVRQIESYEFCNIKQYIIPTVKTVRYANNPNKKSCDIVRRIINKERPDLIHVWGTETVWANMKSRNVFGDTPALLEIQGLLYYYYYYYYGSLSLKEIVKCIHMKELIMPWRMLNFKKRNFRKRGEVEIDSIKSYKYIGYQSEWVRNQIRILNREAKLYSSRIMLRDVFYQSAKWQYHCDLSHPILFTICSGAIPYKGIHVLLKSLELLKVKYANIELRIAGDMFVGNRLLDGYSIYLQKLANRLGLKANVTLLGPIDDEEIAREELKADVCVIPSFIETYCLSLAEAMLVGCPTVVSYTSALPFTSVPNEESLFYNSQDYLQCASNIERLLEDRMLAEKLSINSIKHRLSDNDKEYTIKNQILIYQSIINETK